MNGFHKKSFFLFKNQPQNHFIQDGDSRSTFRDLENRQKILWNNYPTYRVGCSNALFLEIIEGELNYERSQIFNFRLILITKLENNKKSGIFITKLKFVYVHV